MIRIKIIRYVEVKCPAKKEIAINKAKTTIHKKFLLAISFSSAQNIHGITATAVIIGTCLSRITIKPDMEKTIAAKNAAAGVSCSCRANTYVPKPTIKYVEMISQLKATGGDKNLLSRFETG